MRLAFLYRQASPHLQDIFMLLPFSFLSAMGFGKGFVGTPILLLGSLFILKHLSWLESPKVQLSLLKEVPEGVSLLSASRLFSPVSREDAAVFTPYWPQRGPLMGGSTAFSPSHWAPLKALKNFLITPARTSMLSGGDAARNVGFMSTRYRSKQVDRALASPLLFNPPSILDPHLSLIQIYASW